MIGNLNLNDHKGKGLYAVARTSSEAEFENERSKLKSNNLANFANPVENVMKMGISNGMIIADMGAGSGHYTLALASVLGNTGRVYAIDVQKDLLARIKNEADKKAFTNVDIVWADIEKPGGTKMRDDVVDVVLISNTLFQIEEKQVTLLEAKRIIKPNGRLILIDWSESFGGLGPISTNVLTKEKAIDLVSSSGFEFEKEFDAGAHHYGLIFRNKK